MVSWCSHILRNPFLINFGLVSPFVLHLLPSLKAFASQVVASAMAECTVRLRVFTHHVFLVVVLGVCCSFFRISSPSKQWPRRLGELHRCFAAWGCVDVRNITTTSHSSIRTCTSEGDTTLDPMTSSLSRRSRLSRGRVSQVVGGGPPSLPPVAGIDLAVAALRFLNFMHLCLPASFCPQTWAHAQAKHLNLRLCETREHKQLLKMRLSRACALGLGSC